MDVNLTLPGYDASLEGVVYYRVPEPGCLIIRDRDREAFLQRQTTNDISELAPGHALLSVLTDPSARILDVLLLFKEEGGVNGEERIFALTLPGYAPQTAQFFTRRIFFNDQVKVADVSSEFVQLDIEGPKAPSLLSKLGIAGAQEEGLVYEWKLDGALVRAITQRGLSGLGYRLLIPTHSSEEVISRLQKLGIEELSPDGYLVRRIEVGLPAAGHELTNAYTPLETGLEAAISSTKGCYTGQEVIARQITYDKVTQRLVGIKLPSPVEAGTRLWAEGKPAGEITSSAYSPRFGWIALGVIRRPFFDPGTILSLERESAEPAVTVTRLPIGD